MLQVKLLREDANVPVKAHEDDAGFDVFAYESVLIPVGERKLIRTGIVIQNNVAHSYVRVAPRSGLSVKGIDVGAGVIDRGFRGELKVLLINNGKEAFEVKKDMRIAQLLHELLSCSKIYKVDELSDTIRGSGGFGSTGL